MFDSRCIPSILQLFSVWKFLTLAMFGSQYTSFYIAMFVLCLPHLAFLKPEAESKEKDGVWDPMPELTITSPNVPSRIHSNTFTMGIGQPYARVDLNPVPESTLTLHQSRLYTPVRDFGFGLRTALLPYHY
jgi:hypothetical protein